LAIPVWLGLATIDQVFPFQRSTSVLFFASTYEPTAVQVVLVAHDTPANPLELAPAGLRRAAIDQVVPFHRSINTRLFVPTWYEPTAKHNPAVAHAAADIPPRGGPPRWRAGVGGTGAGTRAQLDPFECPTKGSKSSSKSMNVPAVMQPALDGHATPPSPPFADNCGLGLGTSDHAGDT